MKIMTSLNNRSVAVKGDPIMEDQFLNLVANRADVDIDTMKKIFDAMTDTLMDCVAAGKVVALQYGLFYLQQHKGHPVPSVEGSRLDPYFLMKFKASADANIRIREQIKSMDE